MTDGDDGLATVAGGAARLFGGRIFKLLVTFGVQILLARLLGTGGYGGFAIANMLLGVATVLALAGLDQGLTREIPYRADDPRRVRGVVRAGLAIALVTGLVVGGGLFLAAPWVATRVFEDPRVLPLVQLAALAVPFSLLGKVGIAVARGSEDARAQFVVGQLLNPVLSVVFMGGLVLAGFGAVGAMAGLVAVLALDMVVALYLGLRALPVSLRGPTTPMHRPLLAFSLPLLFAASMQFLVANTDTFLLGVFRSSGEVGVYSVVYRLKEVGMFFFYPITYLIPPVLTRLDRTGDHRGARRTYQVATKWLVLATTPVFLLFFLFPGTAIRLSFGAAYLPGTTALRVLMVPVLVTVLLSANGSALVAYGYNRVNLYVNAGVAGLNLVGNLLLIPPLGILGAAVASAAALVVRDVAYTLALYAWEDVQPFSRALVRPFLGGLGLAAVGYVPFTLLFDPTPLRVVGVGLCYLLAYVPLVVALGAVEDEDERLLRLFEERTGTDLDRVRRAVGRLRRAGSRF